MNALLNEHGYEKGNSLPAGLKELMSDISREVLRSQPQNIFDFIANYLSCLLITRENGFIAVSLLEDLCDCQPTLSTHLMFARMERSQASEMAKIIQSAITKSSPPTTTEAKESHKIMETVLKSCPMNKKTKKHVRRIIEYSYRVYWYRKKALEESLLVTPSEPWTLAAQRTLTLFKKTKPSYVEVLNAAEKIQHAYRSYHERRKLLNHFKKPITAHVTVEEDYFELTDLAAHEAKDHLTEEQNIIDSFINSKLQCMVIKAPKPTRSCPHLLADDSSEDMIKTIQPASTMKSRTIKIGSLGERTDILRPSSLHVCRSNHSQNERDVVIDACKENICTKMAPIKKIFEKHVAKYYASNDIQGNIVQMPSYEEKKKTLYRTRHQFLDQNNTEFFYLNDVKIPQILSESFLVAEDGDSDKILIFATNIGLEAARKGNSKQFSGDGTFKTVPIPFRQIYSLHLDLSMNSHVTNVVPVLYALLPDKTESTYLRLFNIIRYQLCINIYIFKCDTYITYIFKCDFEKAQINAVKSTFPDASINGCYFHFNRAVWKKATALGICENRAQRHITRLCASHPLLPAHHIRTSWLNKVDQMENNIIMKKFQKYFNKQWMTMESSTISCGNNQHRRSNNALEGWNRRLNVRMPHKPTLIRFVYILKREAKYQDTRIRNALFSGASRKRNEMSYDYNLKKTITRAYRGKHNSNVFFGKCNFIKKRFR